MLVDLCVQQRFNSICTSAQSDQCLSFLPEETLNRWLPVKHPLETLIRLCECTGRSESSIYMPMYVPFAGHQLNFFWSRGYKNSSSFSNSKYSAMFGCLGSHVCKQPIIALYFELEIVLKFYNLKAGFIHILLFT